MNSKRLIYIIISVIVIIIVLIIAILRLTKNKTEENFEDDIQYVEEAGEEYNSEHLNNFSMNITGLDDDIKSKIPNMEEFTYKLKEYIYLNGLVDKTAITYINYREEGSNLKIDFRLEESSDEHLFAIIDKNKNDYSFSTDS